MVNTQSRSPERRVAHGGAVVGAGAVDQRLPDRLGRAAVLDEAAADPRQAGVAGRGGAGVVADDVVVVGAGDAAALHRRAADAGRPRPSASGSGT